MRRIVLDIDYEMVDVYQKMLPQEILRVFQKMLPDHPSEINTSAYLQESDYETTVYISCGHFEDNSARHVYNLHKFMKILELYTDAEVHIAYLNKDYEHIILELIGDERLFEIFGPILGETKRVTIGFPYRIENYRRKMRCPKWIMEPLKLLLPDHPDYRNTYIVLGGKYGKVNEVYIICEHFECTSTSEVYNIHRFLKILEDIFDGSAYLDYLHSNAAIAVFKILYPEDSEVIKELEKESYY